MKRIAGGMLLVLAMLGGAPVPVVAAPGDVPPRTPVFMNLFDTFVLAKTTYTVTCTDFGMYRGKPSTLSMVAWTLNDYKGKKLASSVTVRDGHNSEYVTATAGGQRATQTISPSPDDPARTTVYRITPKAFGTLKIGVASWGDDQVGSGFLICGMQYLLAKRFNVFIGPQIHYRSSRARIAYVSDFTGGAGIGTGLGTAAAQQRFTRKVSGTAFALFRPGTGAATVIDPKKRARYDGLSGTGSATFAEASKGTWTYTIDAAVAPQSRGPVLWLMEL